MKGKTKCRTCGKIFEWKRTKIQGSAIYCSRKCQGQKIHEYIFKNRFIWKTATSQERKEHIRNLYEENVIKKPGCWDWKNKSSKHGYIVMAIASTKRLRAHRVSWMLHRGDIPKGMFVCHSCDNKRCTNPDHLFLGSSDDNVNDMIQKKRNPFGSKHGCAKLNENQVKEIKKLLTLGLSTMKIGKMFNVYHSTIQKIKQNLLWKNVEV